MLIFLTPVKIQTFFSSTSALESKKKSRGAKKEGQGVLHQINTYSPFIFSKRVDVIFSSKCTVVVGATKKHPRDLDIVCPHNIYITKNFTTLFHIECLSQDGVALGEIIKRTKI